MLRRFPALRWKPKPDWPLVPEQNQADYPELEGDFKVLKQELEPAFRRLDREALRLQNSYRLQNVVLILGGAVVTGLGAVQSVLGGGAAPVAVAQACISGLLAGLSVYVIGKRSRDAFLTTRLKAERLRAEYFLFLGRTGDYALVPDRRAALAGRVREVTETEGPN